MILQIRIVAIIAAISASALSAQTPLPASDSAVADSATRNVVTSYSVRSGKLVLSSTANPGPTHLPDGTYKNQSDLVIVILEGRIARIQSSSGAITEISSIRVNRKDAVALMPSTSGLGAVSEFTMPSGLFTSADGNTTFTVVQGRPITFTIPDSPKEPHE